MNATNLLPGVSERPYVGNRGVTLLPITRVLASITRLAITRHGYEKHFILAEYLGSEYPGSYVGNPGHGN